MLYPDPTMNENLKDFSGTARLYLNQFARQYPAVIFKNAVIFLTKIFAFGKINSVL